MSNENGDSKETKKKDRDERTERVVEKLSVEDLDEVAGGFHVPATPPVKG